ncbi:MAG: extracellular solute-binding protein [Clostridiales bacterium]|nr:extracellular solute-binding protein [Clostridiales bacterium]
MKKFIKAAAACALAFGMCVVPAACGTEDGPDGPGGVTKITMYAYQPEDWAVKYVNSVRDSFNEAYKDSIKLEIRYFYGTQFNSNLATAIENGNCPELFTISYSNLSAYVQNGYLEPLNSYFAEDHWDDIIPQTMDQIKYGDNVIAYPWYIEPSSFLYYRKDIVEDKLGYTADDLQTYDGIYDVCRAMVNKNLVPRGSYPIYIPVGIPRGWATVGMQYNCMNGKYIVSDDWLTSNLNEPGMKDLNKFYYTIGTNGWCPQQDMTERGYEDSAIGLGD